MHRNNISPQYAIQPPGAPIPTQLCPPGGISNLNNTQINVNTNLLNTNFITPGANFISNTNCFPRPITNISQTNDHQNNLRLMPKKRSKKQVVIKRKFTDSEDIALASLVELHGQNNWKLIARSMPSERTARQCRERWKYYLSEGIPNNDDWTREEEKLLLEKYEIYGPHWAKIAKFFDHKNDINLKNRFNKIKRNKLSGMLFDPSISEDFDNATRNKSPQLVYSNQINSTLPASTTNFSSNAQQQRFSDTNTDYSNDDDVDGEENNDNNDAKNREIEKNAVNSSNIDQHYINSVYYPNQMDKNNFNAAQSSFSLSSDSSSIQSSASSGKNSSNASMLNSAQAEIKCPISVNSYYKQMQKDKNDSSESSGNNSASSGYSTAPDYLTDSNSNVITLDVHNTNYRNKNQFSVQSLLLNDKVFDDESKNRLLNNSNSQSQSNKAASNDGNRKLIDFPTPISLL